MRCRSIHPSHRPGRARADPASADSQARTPSSALVGGIRHTGGYVRERGTQSRRLRPGPPDRGRYPADPRDKPGAPGPSASAGSAGSDSPRFWQILAIVAIILATAGWTAAAMLIIRPPAEPNAPAEVLEPTDDFAVLPSDD